jgi:hypothetical protein
MSWKWNEREDAAFSNLHDHLATVLYLRGLRRHMDYKTGIVGIERKISYRMLVELLEERREVGSTKPDFIPTKEGVRWMLKKLAAVGLVERLPSSHIREPMIFKLPLASMDDPLGDLFVTPAPDPVVAVVPAAVEDKPGPIPCPHKEILAIWNEVMPGHVRRPRSNLWLPDRQAYRDLGMRWAACFSIIHSRRMEPLYRDRATGIEWWRGFFLYCTQSPFLMEKCKPFELPWVVRKENFIKIQEGKYHDAQ